MRRAVSRLVFDGAQEFALGVLALPVPAVLDEGQRGARLGEVIVKLQGFERRLLRLDLIP